MLMVGTKLLGIPILSLDIGGEIARTTRAIIDPEDLQIIAFLAEGPLLKDAEAGHILMTRDIREASPDGLIIDSIDRLVSEGDVVRLDEVMSLNFDLLGLKVVTQDKKKLGKVVDYTLDAMSFSVYQLIVQRPIMSSFVDPQLTINRSQITEIDDYKVTIKHDKQRVTVEPKKEAPKPEEFTPNFTNPFRKPTYAPADEDSIDESSSNTSE